MAQSEHENQAMLEIAENLWNGYLKKRVQDMLTNQVSYFKAAVVSPISEGKITVHRPFDDINLSLPCAGSAAALKAGDMCLVLVFGSMSNAYVIGSADLSTL